MNYVLHALRSVFPWYILYSRHSRLYKRYESLWFDSAHDHCVHLKVCKWTQWCVSRHVSMNDCTARTVLQSTWGEIELHNNEWAIEYSQPITCQFYRIGLKNRHGSAYYRSMRVPCLVCIRQPMKCRLSRLDGIWSVFRNKKGSATLRLFLFLKTDQIAV